LATSDWRLPIGERGPAWPTWPLWFALAVVAAAGVASGYSEAVGFGFRYDDYHMVRPWTTVELLGVMHGSWDPTRIEPTFYRPLTAQWYALRFWLFGLNSPAQHLIGLAGMAICAFLTGVFVWRERGSTYAAIVAAGLYAIYPAFVYSQAIWLTNQMHLFASIVVLMALLVWQRARAAGGAAWWWLIALQAVAFGFKEDTIMLLPLLLVLTAWRKWIVGDARFPDGRVLVVGAVLLLFLPYWRYVALGRHLGGYGRPTFGRGWSNFARGLDVLLQHPAKRPWQVFASWYSILCIALGSGAALLRRRWTSVYLLGCGLVIGLLFNLPFYLVAKAEQYHLVGLGCVVALAGGMDALQSVWKSATVRTAIGVALAAAGLCFLPLTRNIASDFSPCSAITLSTDDIALGWWVVPHEVREWIRAKPAACKAGDPVPLTQALATATWAYGRETDESGFPAHWTSDYAVVLMRPTVSRANVTVRSPIASTESPTTVTLDSDGGSYRLVLTDSGWHTQTVRMSSTLGTWLRGMHRLDVHVNPVFKPFERFRNNDTRILGVLMRVPEPFDK
jgi:hypothetical protein